MKNNSLFIVKTTCYTTFLFLFLFVGFVSADQDNDKKDHDNDGHGGKPFKILQKQIDELNDRIEYLEGIAGSAPIAVHVDCSVEGQTVTAALEEYSNTDAPLVINISGLCEENVTIGRDDVSLIGVTPDATIKGTGPVGDEGPFAAAINADRASRITVENLTLIHDDLATGAFGTGLSCGVGSQITANQITIQALIGVLAVAGGSCAITDSTIANSIANGIFALNNSSILIAGTIIENASTGISIGNNATVSISSSSTRRSQVLGSQSRGAFIHSGGSLNIGNVDITGSTGEGILLLPNSTLTRAVGSPLIADNGTFGISLLKNSSLYFAFNFNPADTIDIQNNGLFGMNCDEDVALVQSTVPVFSGNGIADYSTNCPVSP